MFFLKNVCAFILLIGILSIYYCDAEQKEAEKPIVDYLTANYLNVEQNLWRQINSGIDKHELYSIIRNDHKRFIASNFGPIVSQENPSITIQLVNSLYYNASTLLNAENIAVDDIIYLFRTKILQKAIRYANDVFNDASQAIFWEKGKNVCLFSFN